MTRYDIALVEVAEPFDISKPLEVSPICLFNPKIDVSFILVFLFLKINFSSFSLLPYPSLAFPRSFFLFQRNQFLYSISISVKLKVNIQNIGVFNKCRIISIHYSSNTTAPIISIVNELCKSTGLTVLLVEQNANTALAVADHGILLALGKVVADLPAKELIADSALRAAYLGY